MLSLGELQLFLTADVYLAKEEPLPKTIAVPVANQQEALEEEEEKEEELEVEVPVAARPTAIDFHPILFVLDKPLQGLAEEMFKNLINKALNLSEKDYSVLTQEEVAFTTLDVPSSKKIVLFGVPFSGYQQKYKNTSKDGKLVLLADSLEKIAETVELKRQLWAELQLMFPKS